MKLNRLIAASAFALMLGSAAMAAKVDISAHDIGGQVMGGPGTGSRCLDHRRDEGSADQICEDRR